MNLPILISFFLSFPFRTRKSRNGWVSMRKREREKDLEEDEHKRQSINVLERENDENSINFPLSRRWQRFNAINYQPIKWLLKNFEPPPPTLSGSHQPQLIFSHPLLAISHHALSNFFSSFAAIYTRWDEMFSLFSGLEKNIRKYRWSISNI
jgi:hypothetical protein